MVTIQALGVGPYHGSTHLCLALPIRRPPPLSGLCFTHRDWQLEKGKRKRRRRKWKKRRKKGGKREEGKRKDSLDLEITKMRQIMLSDGSDS
jgi:hypothetical protein